MMMSSRTSILKKLACSDEVASNLNVRLRWGRVTARAPVWKPAVVVARLAAPGPPTLYTRYGDWPGAMAIAAVLGLIGLAVARTLTARRGAE